MTLQERTDAHSFGVVHRGHPCDGVCAPLVPFAFLRTQPLAQRHLECSPFISRCGLYFDEACPLRLAKHIRNMVDKNADKLVMELQKGKGYQLTYYQETMARN